MSRPLRAYTDRTITDTCALEDEAARIRERGYATEDGEYRATVRGVAAPVFDTVGTAVAAIGVSGNGAFDGDAVAVDVMEAATELAEALMKSPRR